MSMKYKLLKIVREVGSTTKAVGPSMTKLEADEFAKYNVEVSGSCGYGQKCVSGCPQRGGPYAVRWCSDNTLDHGGGAKMHRSHVSNRWLRSHRC